VIPDQPWRHAPRCRWRWLASRALLLAAIVALWGLLKAI
jgi:hypothetical protein